jgi:hypothetical protein
MRAMSISTKERITLALSALLYVLWGLALYVSATTTSRGTVIIALLTTAMACVPSMAILVVSLRTMASELDRARQLLSAATQETAQGRTSTPDVSPNTITPSRSRLLSLIERVFPKRAAPW